MHPLNFEEVGCAVCGELVCWDKTSRLKSVKNMLNILEAPGMTRTERLTNSMPIKDYKVLFLTIPVRPSAMLVEQTSVKEKCPSLHLLKAFGLVRFHLC